MRQLLSVALASGLVFGCGGSFTMDDVSGAYTLQSVNGQDLPATLADDVDPRTTIEFTSGSITLTAAGTWSGTLSSTATYRDGTTDSEPGIQSGTFTLIEPSTIRFTNGDTLTGTWDGDTITLIELGYTNVFKK